MSDHVHDCPTCGGYFEHGDEHCADEAQNTRECLGCENVRLRRERDVLAEGVRDGE